MGLEMKLSDYVAEFLEKNNVGACFMVSGGAVLHILDSIDRKTKIPIICSQHEQAAASSADAYSRTSDGKIGLAIATSGPGATNLTTGISNAFFDSVPMICITGQVSTFRSKPNKKLRQYGFQETEVVDIFQSITKFTIKIKKPEQIRFVLEKALHLATSDRPGPVLIDIPDDLQRAEVDPEKLQGFKVRFINPKILSINQAELKKIHVLMKNAKRPLLVLGNGIRISKSESQIQDFIEKLNIPFVTSWGAKDIFPHEHKLNIGTFGVCGPRPGNWAISESDLLIIMGCRLNQMQVGGQLKDFAPKAKKIMIDIDKWEIKKFDKSDLKIDVGIVFDINKFIMLTNLECFKTSTWHSWLFDINKKYTIIKEHENSKVEINAYQFINKLSKYLPNESIVFTDAGGNLCWTMQGFVTKSNQRLISSWNHSPMGYSLPAAIGAAIANPRKRITCIIGDGGLMMCLEELATVIRNKLSIDIIIFNNLGHGIQKQTINTWLEGNYIGVDEESGLYFPDFNDIASGFNISYLKIQSIEEFESDVLNATNGPRILDVMIDPEQVIFPMLKFGGDLRNLDNSIEMPKVL